MIHKYKLNGFNIVLDICSGGVHVVDDIMYDMLDLVSPPFNECLPDGFLKMIEEKYDTNDIIETYSEIVSLYNDGVLFSKDDYDAFYDVSKSRSPVKSLCLHIAHDCNLRCKYCFAATGDFGGARSIMSPETGKKAIDFLLQNSGTRHNLEVDFFGGEPLMGWDTVVEVVKYARAKEKEHNKKFRFTITTNGLMLDDQKTEFINKEMSNVVLSIDGRREVNDKLRTRIDDGGSYELIVPKFKKIVENREFNNYYVRGTFTRYNLDFSEDVAHLFDLGFDQISVEPVICDEKYDYSLREEELDSIFNEYDNLSKNIIEQKKTGKNINFFHFMIDLDQGPCVIKRMRGCGCGNEYLAVTPSGELYPCHQFVGIEEYKMGDLDNGIVRQDMKTDFAKSTVYGKEKCSQCWARFYCSGGCNANNYIYNGDILVPHEISCKLEKKRVECAIMIKAALA